MKNDWTKTLDAMRATLAEREAFIGGLIADISRLETENKRLAGLVRLMTTERKVKS